MKALINTLNLTINIHRDSPESTSHESTKRDGADLAEFLMAMSQMELFPDCDEAIDMNFPRHMDSADDAPVMDFNTPTPPAPVMDFNTPTPPAPVMDFNTPTQPADSMDFNTLHADRLQEKICMRITDNYRDVGQAIDNSRVKDNQASVIDACRSAISEDTRVLVPENSWIFRMTDTSDIYVSTFRRWVNYYGASDNYGATAYDTEQEARDNSTDSTKVIVQVPFIELSVKLLRIQLRALGVTFN